MKKRLPLIVVLYMIVCSGIYATTIGFACIHNQEGLSDAHEITTALETELFEICFDYGFIATSVDHIGEGISRYKNNTALIRIFDSSLDYVVAIYCDYEQKPVSKNERGDPIIIWKQIQWKMLDFSSQKVLFEEVIKPEAITKFDAMQKAKTIGKAIGDSILKKL